MDDTLHQLVQHIINLSTEVNALRAENVALRAEFSTLRAAHAVLESQITAPPAQE